MATPKMISRWCFREPQTVSRILTRMGKDGLLSKTKSSDKKNEVIVYLTEKGEQVWRQSLERESIQEIMTCLSMEERQNLYSSLMKLRHKAFENINAVRNQLYFSPDRLSHLGENNS